MRFECASDQSLLVYFGQEITIETHCHVAKLVRLLQMEPIAGIRNLHPAYCSLLIKFDALKWAHEDLQAVLQSYVDRLEEVRLPDPRQVEIPVCYGSELGPDLNDVAAIHGMTPAQVIELHVSAVYQVYFLGFTPGFAYLGGLPDELTTPRLNTPRRKVPAGSVGIAGRQSGVYPFATPGGWRLLGRTPLTMFQPDRPDMSLLSIGNQVRFAPISQEEFSGRKWE